MLNESLTKTMHVRER